MELSPQREDELVVQILRDQVGIDPRSLRPILRLTALGLVNSAWRNTRVEDWHAEGRLHDGDMLRISSHMSWRLDQLLCRWRTQMGIAPDAPAHSLDEISFDDFRWLGGRIYHRGVGFAFRRAAAHGGLACRHWWGHPAWPELVDRFIRALDDPGDPHWGDNGEFRGRLRAEPAAVQDRNSLRRALLQQPWALDFGSAQWIVAAGIGYLRHRSSRP